MRYIFILLTALLMAVVVQGDWYEPGAGGVGGKDADSILTIPVDSTGGYSIGDIMEYSGTNWVVTANSGGSGTSDTVIFVSEDLADTIISIGQRIILTGAGSINLDIVGQVATIGVDTGSTSGLGVLQPSSDNFASSGGLFTIKDGGIVEDEIVDSTLSPKKFRAVAAASDSNIAVFDITGDQLEWISFTDLYEFHTTYSFDSSIYADTATYAADADSANHADFADSAGTVSDSSITKVKLTPEIDSNYVDTSEVFAIPDTSNATQADVLKYDKSGDSLYWAEDDTASAASGTNDTTIFVTENGATAGYSTINNKVYLVGGDGAELDTIGDNVPDSIRIDVDVTDILGYGLTESSNNIDIDTAAVADGEPLPASGNQIYDWAIPIFMRNTGDTVTGWYDFVRGKFDTLFVGDPALLGDTAVVNISTALPGRFMGGEADAHFGDSVSGFIKLGMARLGMHSDTTYNGGLMDVNRCVFFGNNGDPPGNFEFLFFESTGNDIRFGIPKSGAGMGTWNPRSFIIAGPSIYHDSAARGVYWGFDKLAMDTDADGADLGVQNDLQVLGETFLDSIKSSSLSILNIDQDLNVEGFITVTGTVDGVDVAGLETTVDNIVDDTTAFHNKIDTSTAGALFSGGHSLEDVSSEVVAYTTNAYLKIDNANSPGDSIHFWLSNDGSGGSVTYYALDVPDSVLMTAGTANTVQENFVSIVYNGGSPAMLNSTSDPFHTGTGGLIDSFLPLTDVGLGAVSGGTADIRLMSREKSTLYKAQLRLAHLGDKSEWQEGVLPTVTNYNISATAGWVHKVDDVRIPAVNTSGGANQLIVPVFSDSTGYAVFDSITGIADYSDGTALASNHYAWIVIWGSANDVDTTEYKLYMNVQAGTNTYNTALKAEQDNSHMIPTAIPDEFLSTGFLICGMIYAGGGDSTVVLTDGSRFRDLRRVSAGGGGGGAPATDSSTVYGWMSPFHWDWSDSSSHGPDSVLFADSANHADVADSAAKASSADAFTADSLDAQHVVADVHMDTDSIFADHGVFDKQLEVSKDGRFNMPYGNNPTISKEAGAAADTNDHAIELYTGGVSRLIPANRPISFVIPSDMADDTTAIFKADSSMYPHGIQIFKIVVDPTDSVAASFSFAEWSDSLLVAWVDTVANTSGNWNTESYTFTDSTIAVNHYLRIGWDSLAVNSLINIYYYILPGD